MLVMKILAMFGAFVGLSAIGFGPTLMLTSSRYKRRLLVAAALSPVVGFVLVALVLNSLFVVDITIRMSAVPVTLIGLVISGIFVYWDWKRRPEDYRNVLRGIGRTKIGLVVATFMITVMLLLLPASAGHEAFQYYQGSGHDAVNYMLMARYAMDTPASYVGSPADFQNIVNQNPSLSVVMLGTARERPSVTHILAWDSVLFNKSPFDLFYFHRLLHYLIAFCAALALGYIVGLPILYTLALGLVSGTGFWVMMVGDIDAFSQSSVIPIGLLVVFALIQFEREEDDRLLSLPRVFLAISLAGMMSFYPESFLLLLVGFALYYGLSWLIAPSWSRITVILSHIITVIMSLLLQNIALADTLNFWLKQSTAIVGNGAAWNVWVDAAYRWLLRGREFFIYSLWGLVSFRNEGGKITILGVLNAGFIFTLSATLITIIGGGLYKGLLNIKAEIEARIIACVLVAYWGGASLFYMVGLEGIAGKAFAMGAPFMILAVFIFLRYYFAPTNLSNRLIHLGLIVWVFLQVLTFPLRAAYAVFNIDLPPTYISGFRKTEFSELVNPVVNTLSIQASGVVGTDFGGGRYPFYYALLGMLADYHTVLPMENVNYTYEFKVPEGTPYWHVDLDKVPNYMVLAGSRDFLSPIGLGALLQKNDAAYYTIYSEHVAVYTVQPSDFQTALFRADILNPDVSAAPTIIRGFEPIFLQKTGGSFARWMSNGTAELRFISSDSQPLGIYVESAASYDGSLNVTVNDADVGQFEMDNSTRTRSSSLCVTPKVGSNFLKFDHQPDDSDSATPSRVLIQKLLFAPIDTLDIGALSDARQIGTGWQAQEIWDEDTVRWAGETADLQLVTCDTAGERMLHFRAFAPADMESQEVTIRINGAVLGTSKLQTGWDEYTLPVSAGTLSPSGLQSIELVHSQTFVPTDDTRLLATAYDRFWLTSDSGE